MSGPVCAETVMNAAILLADNIKEVGLELSKSVGTEGVIQQRVSELDGALNEIKGICEEERNLALMKIPDHPSHLLVFFSLEPSRRLGWVRMFLATH